jgi:hypothetical protein
MRVYELARLVGHFRNTALRVRSDLFEGQKTAHQFEAGAPELRIEWSTVKRQEQRCEFYYPIRPIRCFFANPAKPGCRRCGIPEVRAVRILQLRVEGFGPAPYVTKQGIYKLVAPLLLEVVLKRRLE